MYHIRRGTIRQRERAKIRPCGVKHLNSGRSTPLPKVTHTENNRIVARRRNVLHEIARRTLRVAEALADRWTERQNGMVTIYTATSGKARETYRAISAFLSKVASASQLSLEERRQRIIAHAFRKYGTIRRMFPPDIGGQMTMPLA